jgi:transcriptional regulator with XRE-family HTH domain
MKIGEVINQYREEHGLSQREFARRCDLSNAQISWLGVGIGSNGKPVKPTFDTVRKVAKGMGISAESLITKCEDFELDLTDTVEKTPLVQGFITELNERTPDEYMLIQAYRLIPVEHRMEALEAILKIKAKYEN